MFTIQAKGQGTDWQVLVCLHGLSVSEACRIPPRLDELLRNIGILQADSRNRPLAEKAVAHVLLQTVALGKNQGAGTSQIGNVASCSHLSGHQPQRAMAPFSDVGNANGHDQQMAQGSRAAICQRAVGSHSLPGYGPVISVNRPVRTRMPGGVGAGGEKPPATRLAVFFEQCLKTAYDLSNDFLRDSSDAGHFARPPVQALYLVRPHHTRHGQSRR